MQRNELLLAIALGALILTGLVYESYRGAGKTAEVIIAHPGITPFDATTAVSISPVSPQHRNRQAHRTRSIAFVHAERGVSQATRNPAGDR